MKYTLSNGKTVEIYSHKLRLPEIATFGMKDFEKLKDETFRAAQEKKAKKWEETMQKFFGDPADVMDSEKQPMCGFIIESTVNNETKAGFEIVYTNKTTFAGCVNQQDVLKKTRGLLSSVQRKTLYCKALQKSLDKHNFTREEKKEIFSLAYGSRPAKTTATVTTEPVAEAEKQETLKVVE